MTGVVDRYHQDEPAEIYIGKKAPAWWLDANLPKSEAGDRKLLVQAYAHHVEDPSPPGIKRQYGLG